MRLALVARVASGGDGGGKGFERRPDLRRRRFLVFRKIGFERHGSTFQIAGREEELRERTLSGSGRRTYRATALPSRIFRRDRGRCMPYRPPLSRHRGQTAKTAHGKEGGEGADPPLKRGGAPQRTPLPFAWPTPPRPRHRWMPLRPLCWSTRSQASRPSPEARPTPPGCAGRSAAAGLRPTCPRRTCRTWAARPRR